MIRTASYTLLLFFIISIPIQAQSYFGPGLKAPDFSLDVAGGKGEKVSLDSYLNKKIVIVHFWKYN